MAALQQLSQTCLKLGAVSPRSRKVGAWSRGDRRRVTYVWTQPRRTPEARAADSREAASPRLHVAAHASVSQTHHPCPTRAAYLASSRSVSHELTFFTRAGGGRVCAAPMGPRNVPGSPLDPRISTRLDPRISTRLDPRISTRLEPHIRL
ncbi:hypothetical protein P7K49_013191 [Saguinus oedipus]|uniref:Uncharacterized protein n=1 Tax=Saguinus oedipus TaxID=9490 RepID=A0ABQ9VF69_SAGOE|nr:hypothetical protein P7K49_013191 [Saguinus oedipus]